MTTPSPASTVHRRHVYYVSGFDPNGPARYYKLYSDGAKQQAALGGADIAVGARTRVDAETMAWQVRYRPSQEAAPAVETSYVFPRWDAIVRAHWWHARWPEFRDLLATSWLYLRTGALWKLMRQSRSAFMTLFAPFLLLAVMLPGLAAVLAAGYGLARAMASDAPLAAPAGIAVGVALLAGTWACRARRHWHERWILRSYAFTGRMAHEGVPALDTRLDAMAAALVRQARRNEDDEILVVGHSSGTMMAATVLARAFQQDPELARRGPAIGLLTLGHCTPLLSNLPGAHRFRQELAVLAAQPGLCWVDFSDAMDDYGMHGVDPLAAAGVSAPRPNHPQMRSPGFGRLFAPGPRQVRRMPMHELHQQYLCANPAELAYDYFEITAGPMALGQRYRG